MKPEDRDEFDKLILGEATFRGRTLHRHEVDFYWRGLKDLSIGQVAKGLVAHQSDPERCMHMPLAGDIRRHVYTRTTQAEPPQAEVLALDSGERWEMPTRQPYMDPALSTEERLMDADTLLAKSDLELQALGLKRGGIEFIRSMLSAATGEDAVRLRVRERLAQTSEAYEMRPAFEGLMPHGVAQEISQRYAREEKPKQKRRKRQGVG